MNYKNIQNDIDNENPLFNCSICLKEDIDFKDICNTNCNHSFCKECIDDWFNRGKNTCPLCRTEIKSFKYNNENHKIINIRIRDQNSINNQNLIDFLRNNINQDINEIMIRNLYNRYRYIKCCFYFSLFTSLNYIINYYNCSFNYNELYNKYNDCENNNTMLLDDLNELNNDNDDISVTIIYDDYYSKCNIPESIYLNCFNN
tara:strand:+ start:136 stop:741 length:606 start_codon:yes stop_codon:yes gene_type:complete